MNEGAKNRRLSGREAKRERAVWSLVFLAVPAAHAQQTANPDDITNLYRRSQAAIVQVVTRDSDGRAIAQGSGFFLSDGRVVTNYHVVAGSAVVELLDSAGKVLGRVSKADALDPKADLAILSSVVKPRSFLKLATRDPNVGESVVAIGSPQGLSNTVSTGIISGIRVESGRRLFQFTAPISPGSSGGPLLNLSGDVLGVNTLLLLEAQNLNFAVPYDEVERLSKQVPAALELASEVRGVSRPATNERAVTFLRTEGSVVGFLTPQDQLATGSGAGDESSKSHFDTFGFYGRAGETLVVEARAPTLNALVTLSSLQDKTVPLSSGFTSPSVSFARLEVQLPYESWFSINITGFSPRRFGKYVLSLRKRRADPELDFDRWLLFSANDLEVVHVDLKSIRAGKGGSVSAWFRHDRFSPASESFLSSQFDRVLALEEFDCGRRRLRHDTSIYYLKEKMVDSFKWKSTDWDDVVPESRGESMVNLLCALASEDSPER